MLQDLKPPFSNIQMELLKLYSVGIDDQTLKELKKEMAKFFLKKLRQQSDKVWEASNYSDEMLKDID